MSGSSAVRENIRRAGSEHASANIGARPMRFDQATIRELHARTDIGTLIGEHVQLRKRGRDLVGLCPFHAEKSPSFHVHPEDGFFKCFGCGAAGDVIEFVKRIESLPFADAVRLLAKRSGVTLEEETPQSAHVRSEREAIFEANALAAAYFVRMLASEMGRKAREYCQARGLTPATLERFGIGFAPDSWDSLAKELASAGVATPIAIVAGLLKEGQHSAYDVYRDRLMVPTRSTTGEIIAFGGRALGEVEPKYLNTSTTPVYTKGKRLFGLDVARREMAAQRMVIVVEGYLDCIALHQAGFPTTVAALGTAFTADHATELRKFADAVFLCFDGDTAGRNATRKAVETAAAIIEHTGSRVRVVRLPEGEDPDSFVRRHGASAFAALLDAAESSLEYRLEPELDRLRDGFASRAVLARNAEELIRKYVPREEWDRWRVYVAGRLQVNVEDLRNSRFLATATSFAPRAEVSPSRYTPASVEPFSYEREVLAIILEDPPLAARFAERIPADHFSSERYAYIYVRLCSAGERLVESADALALFAQEPDVHEVVTSLLRRDRSSRVRYESRDERVAHLERIAGWLEREGHERRYRELSERINGFVGAGQRVPQDVRQEFSELVARLKG